MKPLRGLPWLLAVLAGCGGAVQAAEPLLVASAASAPVAAASAAAGLPDPAALPPTGAGTPATAAPEPVRERPREFLDSLSDNALAADPRQIYRQNGRRREVDLGHDLVAALDERSPQVLSATNGSTGSSGRPGRMLGLSWRQPTARADLWVEKGDNDRLWRLSGGVPLGDTLWLEAGTRDLRSQIDDWSGTPPTPLRRLDRQFGLSWQGEQHDSSLMLRRSVLSPDLPSTQAPALGGNRLQWQGRWFDPAWPGVELTAHLSQTLSRRSDNPELDGARAEIGLSRQSGPQGWWPGARLYGSVAPHSSLLGQDDALTLGAAWQRRVGLELPYGVPVEGGTAAAPETGGSQPWISATAPGSLGLGGALYSERREHSLADADDRLWLLGGRQRWRMPVRWTLQTRVEQIAPQGGTSPKRALQLAEELAYRDFPRRSSSIDLNLIDADSGDSAYLSLQQTERLADDWLGALRLTATRRQPHAQPAGGVSEAKIAWAVGWREPQERRLHLLARYTLALREYRPEYRDPAATDRRAHILLSHLGYLIDPRSTATLRLARRLDHDDAVIAPWWRRTDMVLGRLSVEGEGRWSLSAHLAQRQDSLDGTQRSWGAELGLRLSSKAVLALGYNPRGFSDSELAVDEKPDQGWTLRLRFTIEGAIGRWLDAGRSRPLAQRRVPPPADLVEVRGDALTP
ncbi:MAG: hypothetical protein RJA44_2105 [Pseudomonadota bacterium]